jgi:hypothetical protein
MCLMIHVTDLRDEAFEILEELQNENGHLVSIADAEFCEREWELDAPEFPELPELESDELVFPRDSRKTTLKHH